MFLYCHAATGWTVQGSDPGGGEVFRTRPDRPWGPPSLLYNRYRVFPGVKHPGCGVDHPPLASAEVKERVELYLYCHFVACSMVNFTFTLPILPSMKLRSLLYKSAQINHLMIYFNNIYDLL